MTSEKLRKRSIKFVNALYYETYAPTNREMPIETVADHQLNFYESGNASGGKYDGLHPVFDVKLEDGRDNCAIQDFCFSNSTDIE